MIVCVLDLVDREVDVAERNWCADDDAATGKLAHLLAPSRVRAHHGSLQLGVYAFEPQVEFGSVDHHDVYAFYGESLRDEIAGNPRATISSP